MITAIVQILRRLRRAPGDESVKSSSSTEGATTTIVVGDDAPCPYQDEHKILVFDKSRFVERLVLEVSILHQLPRCAIFLLQFALLMVMVWLPYPASKILPVHSALNDGLSVTLPDGKPMQPSDVKTVSDLQQYLGLLAVQWPTFSPGSSAYMQDPLSAAYLSQVTSFPPQEMMPHTLQPLLGPSFTITAWIQTSVRFDTLLRKVQPGRHNAICWQFDLERMLYGQHETADPVQVVHPLAASIYQEGVVPSEAWKTSLIRSNISDGEWHHYAVMVEPARATFVLDGNIQGSVPLPRPVTDCPNGEMYIGSDAVQGKMLDVKYVPRVLTIVELGFVRTRGKIFSDMLAGAGKLASTETDTQSILRVSGTNQQVTQESVAALGADLTVKLRRVVKTLNDGEALSRRLGDDFVLADLPDSSAPAVAHILAEAPAPPDVRGRRLQGQNTTTTTTTTMAVTTTARAAVTTTTTTTWSSASTTACVDDANYCDPVLVHAVVGTVSAGLSALGPPVTAVGSLFNCLRDHTSHLNTNILTNAIAQPTFNNTKVLLPPDGSCNIISTCVDEPYWQDFQGYTCVDYQENSWCRGGSVKFKPGEHDSTAETSCCVCGATRKGCSDYDGWADGQGRSCTIYKALNLCASPDAASPGPDGHNATVACCACNGGHDYANLTQGTVMEKNRSAKAWADDWGRTCSWYVTNQVCNHTGGIGPGWSNPDTWKGYPPSSQRGATKQPQQRGETAWSVCVGCGGGELVANSVLLEAVQWLTDQVGATQTQLCAGTPGYGARCRYGCARCLIGPKAVDRQAAARALLECHDDFAYQDWLSQGCSWYHFNDPAAAASSQGPAVGACTRYGHQETKTSCRRTCGMCDYALSLLKAYDLDHSQTVSADELNLMVLLLNDADMSQLYSRLFLKTFAKSICLSVGRVDPQCWTKENYPEMQFSLFSGAGSKLSSMMAALAPGLLADLVGSTGFFGLRSDGLTVKRFESPLVLSGSENLATQVEDQSPAVFRECRSDDDCAGSYTTACGNFDIPLNKICSRRYQVPMYCAPFCRTGGCGSTGAVLPKQPGQFCQPCDACFLEVGRACPAWCAGYAVDRMGRFAHQTAALARARSMAQPLPPAQDGLAGSFTLSAWVRNFGSQWLYEKRIRIPGLSQDWAGYDVASQTLVCWQFSPTEVTFRNRWDEKSLTKIANPLADTILSDPTSWHYVALWRNSLIDDSGERREDLRFLVDGLMSPTPTTDWGTRLWQVPSYGFPDCGGQQLSTTLASQNVFEGPRDFYTDVNWPEWNGVYGLDAINLTMPLASGKYGMTAITFADVAIPKNATIKLAYLSVCAARTMADYLIEEQKGLKPGGTVNLKIAGLLANPADISFPANLTASPCFLSGPAGGEARTTSEVTWNIDFQEWRSKAIPQMATTFTKELNLANCEVLSPDVASIVEELVRRLDARGATSRDLTFVISDKQKPWGQCGASTFIQNYTAFAESSAATVGVEGVYLRNQLMSAAMPVWMIPLKDSQRTGAKKARLLVQYCLNKDCVSPSFLGAGLGAVQAAADSTVQRRLAEEDTGNEDAEDADEAADLQDGSRRLLEVGACGEVTCTHVGTLIEDGDQAQGSLFDPRYISRAMALSELQAAYYEGLPLVQPEGGDQISGSQDGPGQPALDVPQYPSEVVSIIPPVMFQARSPIVPCDQLVPSLATSLMNYFTTQIESKCNETYSCSQNNGFGCVDRAHFIPTTEQFFESVSIPLWGIPWYHEFLDLYTVPYVYRNGDMMATGSWIDIQTSQVMIVNAFLTPGLQAGTVLEVNWKWAGVGRLQSWTNMQSYMNMSPADRRRWFAINQCIVAIAIVDLLIIFGVFIARLRFRRCALASLQITPSGTKTSVSPTRKQEHRVICATPLGEHLDLADIALRATLIAFCFWHYTMYPNPKEVQIDGHTQKLEYMDEPIKAILDLPWADPTINTDLKVYFFMEQVKDLYFRLDKEVQHRFWAKVLILWMFVRTVAYMRIHPRIAIMYATIKEMCADFLHFLVLFCTIYGVMAFWGTWSFGDKTPDFGDFQTTLYTQFHMMVGEYNMPTGEQASFTREFGIYCILFFLMVFSLLLNFFLAIVIDSYSTVKDCVKECQVESSLPWDLLTSLAYPVVATCCGWPSRERLINGLLAADLDEDGQNDETSGQIAVTAAMLKSHSLVKGERAAALMQYYNVVCPALRQQGTERKAEVQHRIKLRHLTEIDEVRHELFGQQRRCAIQDELQVGVKVASVESAEKPALGFSVQDAPAAVPAAAVYNQASLSPRSRGEFKELVEAMRRESQRLETLSAKQEEERQTHLEAMRREAARLESLAKKLEEEQQANLEAMRRVMSEALARGPEQDMDRPRRAEPRAPSPQADDALVRRVADALQQGAMAAQSSGPFFGFTRSTMTLPLTQATGDSQDASVSPTASKPQGSSTFTPKLRTRQTTGPMGQHKSPRATTSM